MVFLKHFQVEHTVFYEIFRFAVEKPVEKIDFGQKPDQHIYQCPHKNGEKHQPNAEIGVINYSSNECSEYEGVNSV